MEISSTTGNFCSIFLILSWLQEFPLSIILSSILCLLFVFSTLILAGAERAMFSFSASDLEDLNIRSSKAYAKFQKVLEQPKLLVATIQLLLTLVSTGLIVLLTFISIQVTWPVNNILWPFFPEIIFVAILMVLIMHTIPNALAEKNNVYWTMLLLPGLSILLTLFYPITKLMLYSEKKVDQTFTDVDSSDTIEGNMERDTEEQEVQLLKGIMKFGSIQVKQIMKSRPDVIAINEEVSFDEMMKVVKESGYSRIPVFKIELDNIIGTLYTKDLLSFLDRETHEDWKKIIRPAFFVPEGKNIAELLIEFQFKMIHQAIVIDEYGSTAGIVTLEDIVEEIIGEIRDETDDKSELEYTQINEHDYIFEGKVLLNDMYRLMQISDSAFEEIKGDIDSVGGLVMELSGKIPHVNEELMYKNFRFKVLNMDSHRVKKVRVSQIDV